MPVGFDNHVTYEYEWGSEYPQTNRFADDHARIYHFVVSAGNRREGHGTRAMQNFLEQLAAEGATRVWVTMGGGEGAAEFLRDNGFTVDRVRNGSVEAHIDLG